MFMRISNTYICTFLSGSCLVQPRLLTAKSAVMCVDIPKTETLLEEGSVSINEGLYLVLIFEGPP